MADAKSDVRGQLKDKQRLLEEQIIAEKFCETKKRNNSMKSLIPIDKKEKRETRGKK